MHDQVDFDLCWLKGQLGRARANGEMKKVAILEAKIGKHMPPKVTWDHSDRLGVFAPQLKNMNSDQQLVSYLLLNEQYEWVEDQPIPSNHLQSHIAVHPNYIDLEGLTYLGLHNNLPVFQKQTGV